MDLDTKRGRREFTKLVRDCSLEAIKESPEEYKRKGFQEVVDVEFILDIKEPKYLKKNRDIDYEKLAEKKLGNTEDLRNQIIYLERFLLTACIKDNIPPNNHHVRRLVRGKIRDRNRIVFEVSEFNPLRLNILSNVLRITHELEEGLDISQSYYEKLLLKIYNVSDKLLSLSSESFDSISTKEKLRLIRSVKFALAELLDYFYDLSHN